MRSAELRAALDADAFATVERAVFPKPWKADDFTAGPNRIACGLWLDQCIGFVYGQVVAGEAELWRIAVRDEHRRMGYAAQLYRAFSDQCRAQKVAGLFLEVAADNHGAVAFYQQMGMTQCGRRLNYYGDGADALLFSVDLS